MRNRNARRSIGAAAVKLGLLGIVAALGIGLFAGTQREATPAQASPVGGVALNSALCTALGIAFAGIPTLTALGDCKGFGSQGNFQQYTQCLLKIPNVGCPLAPGNPLTTNVVLAKPADFAGLDRDKNQIHEAQDLKIIAFVNDDFPVRFTTDLGKFVDSTGATIQGNGKQFECTIASEAFGRGDPDCDGDPATLGDGVVVATLKVDGPAIDPLGTGHIVIEQENIGFPLEFTVVGKPEEITLTPFLGKDTISTGATPPTPSTIPPTAPQPSNCDFAATVEGVLAAQNQSEKTVVIAKALDNKGNEVVGALLDWDHPVNPAVNNGIKVGPTLQAGVALPQTPTLDLGNGLGVGFPQFVCGLDEPGDFTTTVTLDPVLDVVSSTEPGLSTNKSVTIHVIKPAANIALSVDPAELDCNGTNTAKVTASVTNADGIPVANGLDVNFSIVVLGTANPLKADSAAGVASSVISPLAGAGALTADGGPTGVPVTVSVNGRRIDRNFTNPVGSLDPFDLIAHPLLVPDFATVQSQILVRCTGAPPPAPAAADTAGGAAGAGARPSGRIAGPDTGTGDSANGGGWLSSWIVLTLGIAAAGSLTVCAGALKRGGR